MQFVKNLLLNLFNKFSNLKSPWGTSLTVWRDAYKEAINTIRQSGWNGSLIITASAYGQNPDGEKFLSKN